MKKFLLPFVLTLMVFLFNSCDDSLPKASLEEAQLASLTVFGALFTMDLSDNGITVTDESTATEAIYVAKLTSYSISDEVKNEISNMGLSCPYTSISGKYTETETMTSEGMIIDFSLTGGPVVTLYISMIYNDSTGEIENKVIINGHDMTTEMNDYVMANY